MPPGHQRISRGLADCHTESAGQDARLYGRRDARRYAKQILSLRERVRLRGKYPVEHAKCSIPEGLLSKR